MVVTAYIENKPASDKTISIERAQFKTSTGFKIATLIILVVLTVIYTMWW